MRLPIAPKSGTQEAVLAWLTFDNEIHETIFPIVLSHGLLRFYGK